MEPVKKYLEIIITLAFLIIPVASYSQMFSVEEPVRRSRPASNALTFGMDFMNMELRNDINNGNGVYNFNDPILRLRLELPAIEGYVGYKNRIGEADSLSYLNFGANLTGSMPVAVKNNYGILIPLWLSTDYIQITSINSDQPESGQFRQSSVSIGIGAAGFLLITNNVRIKADIVPQIGFTVASLGSDSGQLASLNGKLRLYWDQIINRFGLVTGYNYNWRRYSGNDELLHYDITSHNLTVGISF